MSTRGAESSAMEVNHRAAWVRTGNFDLVFDYRVNTNHDLSLTISLTPYIKLSSTEVRLTHYNYCPSAYFKHLSAQISSLIVFCRFHFHARIVYLNFQCHYLLSFLSDVDKQYLNLQGQVVKFKLNLNIPVFISFNRKG